MDAGGVAPLAREPIVGAEAVAEQVLARGSRFAPHGRPALVNGGPGVVVTRGGRRIGVVGMTIRNGRITHMDLVIDQAKLQR